MCEYLLEVFSVGKAVVQVAELGSSFAPDLYCSAMLSTYAMMLGTQSSHLNTRPTLLGNLPVLLSTHSSFHGNYAARLSHASMIQDLTCANSGNGEFKCDRDIFLYTFILPKSKKQWQHKQ